MELRFFSIYLNQHILIIHNVGFHYGIRIHVCEGLLYLPQVLFLLPLPNASIFK